MTHFDHPSWRRGLRTLALAIAVAAAPLSCLAGETAPAAPTGPTLKTSIAKAVAAEARAGKGTASMRAEQQGGSTTDLASGAFFKSPAGIITLVAIAAGVGYALYSTSNDRVESPNRDYKGGRP